MMFPEQFFDSCLMIKLRYRNNAAIFQAISNFNGIDNCLFCVVTKVIHKDFFSRNFILYQILFHFHSFPVAFFAQAATYQNLLDLFFLIELNAFIQSYLQAWGKSTVFIYFISEDHSKVSFLLSIC